MAKSFSEDGAYGAGATTNPTDGGAIGGTSVTDFGGTGGSSAGGGSGFGGSSQSPPEYADILQNLGTPGSFNFSGDDATRFNSRMQSMTADMAQNGNWNYTTDPRTGKTTWKRVGKTDPFTSMKAASDLGISFARGGAVPDPDDPDAAAMADGGGVGDDIALALSTVDEALAYGRKLHGLGGDDDGTQVAADYPSLGMGRMPSVPGNQSESGLPRPQPMPGRLPPTSNPFGKRMAGLSRMPTTPGSQSESGVPRPQPMPGPLPPTSNPFGQRRPYASAEDSDGDEGGAIPDDQETA